MVVVIIVVKEKFILIVLNKKDQVIDSTRLDWIGLWAKCKNQGWMQIVGIDFELVIGDKA